MWFGAKFTGAWSSEIWFFFRCVCFLYFRGKEKYKIPFKRKCFCTEIKALKLCVVGYYTPKYEIIISQHWQVNKYSSRGLVMFGKEEGKPNLMPYNPEHFENFSHQRRLQLSPSAGFLLLGHAYKMASNLYVSEFFGQPKQWKYERTVTQESYDC